MSKSLLYIFSGLPGTGKSTLAQELAKVSGACYLRIDTIEQAIRELCDFKVEGEGYRLAYRIAADNLRLGKNVIADSCNPIRLTRDEWNNVAIDNNAIAVNIEIICSDLHEHQWRVETRTSEISGMRLPTWEQVQNREYHDWHCNRLVIDTFGKSIALCGKELLEKISRLQSAIK